MAEQFAFKSIHEGAVRLELHVRLKGWFLFRCRSYSNSSCILPDMQQDPKYDPRAEGDPFGGREVSGKYW